MPTNWSTGFNRSGSPGSVSSAATSWNGQPSGGLFPSVTVNANISSVSQARWKLPPAVVSVRKASGVRITYQSLKSPVWKFRLATPASS